MVSKNIKVRIGTREDMAKEFLCVWRQAEAGQVLESKGEIVYFNDDDALFKALTPKRRDLLRYVHEHAKITILALSKQLARNYRNVYQDVKELSQLGLIVKDTVTNKYSVPWDAIVTEISLSDSGGKKSEKTPHVQAHHEG